MRERGKLIRIGHGVYRIDKYFPQETDVYAAAIAKVGAGAYVVGESVLGFYDLCLTHEAIIHIGTPKRVRRRLPQTIQLVKRPEGECLHLGAMAEGDDERTRSAVERFLFRHLEDFSTTKGLFELNGKLDIPFGANPFAEVDFLSQTKKQAVEIDGCVPRGGFCYNTDK